MLVQAVPTKQMLYRNGNFDWISSQMKTFLAAGESLLRQLWLQQFREVLTSHGAGVLQLLGEEGAEALTSYKMEQDVNSQPFLKLLKQNLPEFV